jgi:hypothetical protein
VASQKKGRVRTVRLEGRALSEAESWLCRRRQEWEARLDRFEDHLSEIK